MSEKLELPSSDQKPESKKLRESLTKLSQDLITDPVALTRFAASWKKGFHSYSFFNMLLIYWQNPKATLCAGKYKWTEVKRTLKADAKPCWILAPLISSKNVINSTTGVSSKADVLVGFFPVRTYDVGMTEGKPLDIGGTQVFSHENLPEFDTDVLSKTFGIPIKLFESDSDGLTDGKEILIARRENKAQMYSALFHELAHCWLGHIGSREPVSRQIKEIEAEATNFLVCECLGFQNDVSKFYISHWGGKKEDLDKAEKVLVVAERIISKLGWSKTIIANKHKRQYKKREYQID